MSWKNRFAKFQHESQQLNSENDEIPAELSPAQQDAATEHNTDLLEQGYTFLYVVGMRLIRLGEKGKNTMLRHAKRAKYALVSAVSHFGGQSAKGFKKIWFKISSPFKEFGLACKELTHVFAFHKRQGGSRYAVAKAGVHVGKGFASNVRSAPKVLRKAVNYLAPALGLVVLGFTIGHYMNTTYALQVNLNGTDLGYIQDESVFQQAEKNFKQRIVYAEDQEVMQMQPVYTVMAVNRNELLSSGQITDTLIQATGSEVAHASGLYIDNNFMGATVDGQELRQILTDMLDEYRSDDPSETVRFASEVKVLDGLYLSSSIVDLNNIESTLNSEVSAQQVYTVQSGDAPTLIAQKTNTPYEELKRLNPDIEDSLLIGQEVLISKSVPFLAVETVRTEIYEEEIDFKVEQVVDASQYKGYNQIQNYGSKGEKRIVAQVTYLDGVETDREILSTQVLKEPVNETVLVGSKVPENQMKPSVGSTGSVGSGTFIWPVGGNGGYVSCGLNGYWGHTGQDIAGISAGTPIYASASGTVVVATRRWDYGNYVVIDHGGGVTTLYAHNSVLYVTPGQWVNQGDVIAGAGRTGNSTGVHCHFEIKINGRIQNPRNYIGWR